MPQANSLTATDQLEALMQELALSSPEHKINPSLQAFHALLAAMGDPQLSLQSIMVGGTNGKTSTTLMIQSLAVNLGFSVGVFTSPHLQDLRERIRINDQLVSAEMMVDAIQRVSQYANLLADSIDRPTYFETLTAAAIEIFADLPVDLAILEVGMGGKWDATNVTNPVAACLLPISLDHMQFLGDTIEEIAADKCHIIKPSSVAVVATQSPKALAVIESRCQEVGAPLLYQGRDFEVTHRFDAVGGQSFDLRTPRGEYRDLYLPLFGAHQAANAGVAVTAIEQATPTSEPIAPEVLAEALAQVTSPGRIEIVGQSPLFLIDACHNPAGAEVTANAIAQSFALNDFVLIFGVMNDKDALAVLQPLIRHGVALVVVATDSPRATSVEILAAIAEENFPQMPVYKASNVKDACRLAVDLALKYSAQTGVLAAGSIALAGAVREWALNE